ncbi:MAG: class I SAM-dependent methyltransferase [Candidatus Sumerlaeia bacterium]
MAFQAILRNIAGFLPRPVAQAGRAVWRRLPPRDKRYLLHDLETESKRTAFLESPDYRRFCDIEGAYWAGVSSGDIAGAPAAEAEPAPARIEHVWQHPLARKLLYAIPGLNAPDFWSWLASRGSGYGHVFVPGAGAGNDCRVLIDMGFARRVDANDISEELAARAQAVYESMGYGIRYVVGDLNKLTVPRNKYDAVVAIHALHHAVALERLARELARSLKSGGELFMEEYVGPRYLKYPDAVRRHVRRWHKMLPERLRRDRGGAAIRSPRFRDEWEVQKSSPFESIRSDKIVPVLSEYFAITELWELGGGLAMPLLEQTIRNYDPADSEANDWLARIMEEDRNLTSTGAIPNFFAILRARPRS